MTSFKLFKTFHLSLKSLLHFKKKLMGSPTYFTSGRVGSLEWGGSHAKLNKYCSHSMLVSNSLLLVKRVRRDVRRHAITSHNAPWCLNPSGPHKHRLKTQEHLLSEGLHLDSQHLSRLVGLFDFDFSSK